MIFILDNGCDYSDHAVHFIDADGYVTADVLAVLDGLRANDRYSLENSHIIAYGHITIRRKSAMTPLHKFLDLYTVFDSEEKLLPCIADAKLRFQKRLFGEWIKDRSSVVDAVLKQLKPCLQSLLDCS